MGARGAFEFFATVLMPEPPQEPAAKKSSDETPAAPQPVVRSGSTIDVVFSGVIGTLSIGGIQGCTLRVIAAAWGFRLLALERNFVSPRLPGCSRLVLLL